MIQINIDYVCLFNFICKYSSPETMLDIIKFSISCCYIQFVFYCYYVLFSREVASCMPELPLLHICLLFN